MPQLDKTKRDNLTKQIDKAQALIAKFQEKIKKINADGEVTSEEQIELDMINNAIGNFQAKIDRLVPAEPETPSEPTPPEPTPPEPTPAGRRKDNLTA